MNNLNFLPDKGGKAEVLSKINTGKPNGNDRQKNEKKDVMFDINNNQFNKMLLLKYNISMEVIMKIVMHKRKNK